MLQWNGLTATNRREPHPSQGPAPLLLEGDAWGRAGRQQIPSVWIWCFLQNGRILDVLCMCEPIMPRPSPPPRRPEPSNAVMTKSSTVTRLRHFATVLGLVELPAQLRKRSLRSLCCRSDGVSCSAAVTNSFHSASPFIPERGSHHQTVGSNTYCASWTSGFALDPATARNAEIVLLSAVPSGSLIAARRA